MMETSKGDIFQSAAEALVNPVNCVGVMGKGLARQFRDAYPRMNAKYVEACRDGDVLIGEMWVYGTGNLLGPKWIINFPTKVHWKDPSKKEYIENGLIDLADRVHAMGIRSVAIPALGCGLGQLDWGVVYPMLQELAQDLPQVRFEIYDPQ